MVGVGVETLPTPLELDPAVGIAFDRCEHVAGGRGGGEVLLASHILGTHEKLLTMGGVEPIIQAVLL